MIGFLLDVRGLGVVFALVAQGFYKPQPLFQKARFVDEIIGGILGLVEAGLILGAVVVILDSFFRLPGIPTDPHELPFLRDIWTALDVGADRRRLPRHAHPGVLRALRVPRARLHRGLLPERLSVLDRAVLAAPTLEAARRLLGARLVRDDETGRRVGPDRRGRGLHRAGRPGVARPLRRDGRATGSCSGRRAMPTCTLSTGCTTASTS